ncbi:DUF1748-domain-containing protein [Macrolepiota fuliginosa MF-IS2]|uniref:DUF1748-domain-containing protein n=1 Tax=Macrolepiota fuliginosa MF-IS2 TaxID=1400762 RepID=A0A9P6C4C7_9AGAR|nr:DUF1748-domain-containing protein [Macrolepiota fuliginosa MF-IS2]
MALGRLAHYAFDAVLLSTVLAGVRRSSGFSPDVSTLSDSTFRSAAEKFLGVGESVFDMLQATAVNSSYFTKEDKQHKS